jgi:hypothetical protein
VDSLLGAIKNLLSQICAGISWAPQFLIVDFARGVMNIPEFWTLTGGTSKGNSSAEAQANQHPINTPGAICFNALIFGLALSPLWRNFFFVSKLNCQLRVKTAIF